MTDTAIDEHVGWSVHCRADHYQLCDDLKFRCTNPRHTTEGETSKRRAERLRAEARAAITTTTPVETVPCPGPGPVTSAVTADLVALLALDGEINHPKGRAAHELRTIAESVNSLAQFENDLAGMRDAGLLDVDHRGARITRITLTDAGEQLATTFAPATVVDEPESEPDPPRSRTSEKRFDPPAEDLDLDATPPRTKRHGRSDPGAHRYEVLDALVASGGVVEQTDRSATKALMAVSGWAGGDRSFYALIAAMVNLELIERDWHHVRITDAGRRMLDDRANPEADPPPPLPDTPLRGVSPSSLPRDPRDPKVELVWEEPRVRVTGRRALDEVLDDEGVFDALRSKPGEWARLITYGGASSASTAVKKLKKVERLAGFEWLSKSEPQLNGATCSGSWLYGRYVGDKGA